MDSLEKQILALKARIRELESGVQADQVLRSIAINSPSNIMLLDMNARIQYINHTVPGITPAELVGQCLLDIVEEQFRPGIRGALDRVAKTGEPDRYETSYTSPSGDYSWWESGVGPVLQDSKVTGYVVVSTNTTERRRINEEQERFFNLSVDMMCVAGFDGYFKRVNQAFRMTLGYGNELLERPFLSFVHPDDVQATIEAVAQVSRGEPTNDFCNRYRAANGSYRLLSWRGVGDRKREVIYAVARDITESKKLEDQLQQSRRMEAIGKLAGGIAHDFNNLLTAIKGNIDLAEKDPAFSATYLPAAKEAANRAAALTHQLLLFSRNQPLSPVVLNLNRVLDEVMNLLRRLLPENITVNLQHAEEAPPILADRSQLEQVIMNLCVNARDAMPQGGLLSLTVKKVECAEIAAFSPAATAAEYLSLSVTDTGCGMSPEVQTRIFEPFFTTKETGKGTGLGLATVYGIVQKHEGFLQVKSQPGHGATFTVYLPTTAQSMPAPAVTPHAPVPDTGGTETILIAEDEPMVRATAARLLTHAGYTVLEANDGHEAVRLFSQNAPRISLALLDVVMPHMGGLETAAHLRRLNPNLRVIFASGHVQSHEDQKRLETEILLPKPYERLELLRCIRRILDSQRHAYPDQ